VPADQDEGQPSDEQQRVAAALRETVRNRSRDPRVRVLGVDRARRALIADEVGGVRDEQPREEGPSTPVTVRSKRAAAPTSVESTSAAPSRWTSDRSTGMTRSSDTAPRMNARL